MHTLKYRKIVELSHPIEENMPCWPDENYKNTFTKKNLSRYQETGFYYNHLSFSEHTSTHIDAPIHTAKGKLSIEQLPIENFIVHGCVIDVTRKVKQNFDYELEVDDILEYERINGKIKSNSFIIMRTDWSDYWNQPKKYLNTDDTGIMHFPGFSKEPVEFLIKERFICGIGVETLSIDPGDSADFQVHKILLENNKFAIENLTNIKYLPQKNFTLIALPLRIVSGSGSPATVIGLF